MERSVEIAAPVEDVFAFHLDPAAAAAIAPRGIVLRGDAVDPPHRIVHLGDGPRVRAWRHEHHIQPLGPGRTLLTERVAYRLSGGALGRLAGRLVLRRVVERALAERQRSARQALEARAGAEVAARAA